MISDFRLTAYGRVAVETVSNEVPLNLTTFTVRGLTVVVVVVLVVVEVRIASVRIEITSGCPISTLNRVVGRAVLVNAASVAGSLICGFSATSLLSTVVVVPLVDVVDATA